MNHLSQVKKICIFLFVILGIYSATLLPNLRFSFDFSQFFPEEDPDLEFYQDFVAEFGTDDNFLLIAVENKPTVFNQEFLKRFHAFSEDSKDFDFVEERSSLTTLSYPLKTSFGYTQLPIIHLDDPSAYEKDWEKIKQDKLFTNFLIDQKATSTVVALRTQDDIDYQQAEILLSQVRSSLKKHQLDEYHILGRAFFLEAIVDMQKSEVLKTSIIAAILVLIILLLVYRSLPLVLISMLSISVSLLLFLGILALWGKELNAMAAFYPVLMLIVGTSDVIHVTDSFIRKIQSGIPRYKAIRSSLREVGLTTLLTSVTTAVGFMTLLSSRLASIQEFGINAAIGVMVAYITIIFFTGSLLISLPERMLLGRKSVSKKWVDLLQGVNTFTKDYPRPILLGTTVFTILCLWGISLISTNYEFKRTLPNRSEIAADFEYFQNNYAGFRPLEIAVMSKNDYSVLDYSVALEINKLMNYLAEIPSIGNLQSSNLPFQVLHKAHNLNKSEFLTLPDDAATFEKYKKDIQKLGRQQLERFVNKDASMARINGRLQDIGTDSLKLVYEKIENYADTKLDTTQIKVKVTGKSMLLDKNAEYIRSSLLEGLFFGLLLIGVIMVLVFRNLKLFIISLIPNMLPILFAGSVLGYLNIPLEASLSVVFAIVFGIAVDDTIHFLGKYKLGITQGLTQEQALEKTFAHTGRALVITTVILFFGFLVLLFSIHQPSITIGIIISVTLVTALILDILLLPVLIRKMIKEA
ncbi:MULTISPECIES: efflux RND transporter permease subunit [Maribacter]|uniref:MMPL family transporter n=1 Tax=Maribacter flavus TaxID=1658664 RepID=A0ABU7IJF3_9FLAO|nr:MULTISPECIES: MMPL family transporter [Maribacter]MDC6406112.1 MMPL family transporter [Maribacter sp. PR66]MEE1973103.1 MMPL family transporter [Maribacter flavus]